MIFFKNGSVTRNPQQFLAQGGGSGKMLLELRSSYEAHNYNKEKRMLTPDF